MSETNLTPLELNCLAKLEQAWNEFLLLPEQHPDDQLEMRLAIHMAQNVILARPTLRQIAEG